MMSKKKSEKLDKGLSYLMGQYLHYDPHDQSMALENYIFGLAQWGLLNYEEYAALSDAIWRFAWQEDAV